jgi:dTDP-glucose 4,6-dehydratase
MHLLVTGACGFIGGHFVRRLLSAPRELLPFQRLVNLDALTYAADPEPLAGLSPASRSDPRYHFVHGDITDAPLLARLFAEHRPDAVVHFAAETHVDRSIDEAAPFLRTNILGTQCLLEAARSHLSTLPEAHRARFRFLQISTDEVYGSLAPADPAFTENNPLAPRSPYAASKAAGDLLALAAHHTHGLPLIIARCSNNYGPRQFPEKLLPLFLISALENRPLPLYGDGQQSRDWLHVDDHCTALLQLLFHARPGSTYNLGGACELTNLGFVHALCSELDRQAPRPDHKPHSVAITHVADRPGHDRRYAMDFSRVRQEFGWSPRHDLASGLAETVAWYLAHEVWWRPLLQGRAGGLPRRGRPPGGRIGEA